MIIPCSSVIKPPLNATPKATPIATKPIQDLPALPQTFFCRPAEEVASEVIGCLLVKHQEGGELLWRVVVVSMDHAMAFC